MTVAPTPIESNRGHHRGPLFAVLLVLVLAAVVALLAHYDVIGGSSTFAGLQGSGHAAAQTRAVAPFHGIELAGSNNVVIRVGEQQSVTVKADDNLLDRVTTHVTDESLVIDETPGSFTTKSPMSVEVTVPSLTEVTISGSGNCVVTGVRSPSLKVDVPGSGVVTAAGAASRLDVSLSGSGVAQLRGLVAREVQASVSGSGTIFTTVTSSLDASVSGSGAILYGGNPQEVTTSITGQGAINPS
jgi:putative autotransporter adhesin-like protein